MTQSPIDFLRDLAAGIGDAASDVASTTISASVGAGGVNETSDVIVVAMRLAALGFSEQPLEAAIRRYQREVVGLRSPDGRVDPEGRTLRALRSGSGARGSGTTPGVHRDWSAVPETERMAIVMRLLVEIHGYPENGAAGLVGNLHRESGLIPNRVEGSTAADPMRARDATGVVRDFTAQEVMDRVPGRAGPEKPGVGLAQWTAAQRRAALFRSGPEILYDLERQVQHLVAEPGSPGYARVDRVLRRADVTIEEASDEVLYRFEVPGAILQQVTQPDGTTRTVKRDRSDPQVQPILEQRRESGRRCLAAYRRG